jgi:uncharacterized repeat protein (TIGR03847 family)
VTSYILDPVDWASAGAVGDPGQRTFYLQARQGPTYVAVVAEKEQVASLVQVARELLASLGAPLRREELAAGDFNLEPVQPVWRAGTLRMGADERGERFLLEIDPAGRDRKADDAVIRLTMGRDELVALAADAAYAIEPDRLGRCRRCGRRLDPDRLHHC